MDKADYGKRWLACPVLAIWGSNSHVGRHYKPLAAWAEWADNLRGFAVPTGHYPAEQRPDLILDAFQAFFAGEEPLEPQEVAGRSPPRRPRHWCKTGRRSPSSIFLKRV